MHCLTIANQIECVLDCQYEISIYALPVDTFTSLPLRAFTNFWSENICQSVLWLISMGFCCFEKKMYGTIGFDAGANVLVSSAIC